MEKVVLGLPEGEGRNSKSEQRLLIDGVVNSLGDDEEIGSAQEVAALIGCTTPDAAGEIRGVAEAIVRAAADTFTPEEPSNDQALALSLRQAFLARLGWTMQSPASRSR